MALSAEYLVAEAMSSFDQTMVPQILQTSIERHRQDLVSLAAALVAGGQDEKAVKRAVDSVFSSYRNELISTIMAMRENRDVC